MKCPLKASVKAWSQLVRLFWEEVETSGDGAKKKKRRPPCPILSLLPFCKEVNTFLYTISLVKMLRQVQSNGAANHEPKPLNPFSLKLGHTNAKVTDAGAMVEI